MPRKFDRSVVSSYQAEDDPKKAKGIAAIELGTELADGDQSNYDPDGFYLRATDFHGHAKTIQVTIPTTFGAPLGQIVESVSNPYRSAVDFARDAVIHHIARRLKEMEAVGESIDWDWLATEELERIRFETEAKLKFIQYLEDACEIVVVSEDWHLLNQVLYRGENRPLPTGLRKKRDEIVRKYREMIPEKYHYSYDSE
jgi:hypothetical protein